MNASPAPQHEDVAVPPALTNLAPIASVVVPTRNRAQKISACLAALARQTQSNFEVLVVDDGSTDDTSQVLAQFAPQRDDLEFRRFRHETSRGANPSRNLAIRASRGAFVAFLDDDCIPDPTWLQRLLAAFDSPAVAAVTGLVEDVAPVNLFDLTLKGTHRVFGRRQASRLVAGNMCLRRDVLLVFALDEDRAGAPTDMSVSGRGDEEGLYLSLRVAGFEQVVAHDARVVHDHPYSARSFFRQAYRSGGSAARLGYKYRLPLRPELLALLLTYLTLPLCLAVRYGWAAPALFGALFVGAILYNDICRKQKTIGETALTLPLLLLYYHTRAAGYFRELLRLWLGRNRVEQILRERSQAQR